MRDGRALGPTLLFLALALVGLFIMSLTGIVESIARDWPATPCVVESSQVSVRGRNKFGDTLYRIDIVYAYQQNGRDYRCNCYDMWDSPNDRAGMRAVVAAFPEGRHTVCFVDPNNPAHALLDRSVPGSCVPVSLLGVTLVLAAIAGLLCQFWFG